MTHNDQKRGSQQIARAISIALGLTSASSGWAQVAAPAADQSNISSGASNGEIQEVVVTATRRTENLQDVPIAITALTGETLQQLNVQTLDDYVKYLPGVSITDSALGRTRFICAAFPRAT